MSGLKEAFDAIASGYDEKRRWIIPDFPGFYGAAVRHLEKGEKRELYRKVFAALKEGGVFVNADEVAGESDEIHHHNLEFWDDFLMKGPLGREEARAIIKRRETLDQMEKLSVQLGWLKEIGFTDVDIVYKNRCFAVFTGRRTH